MLRQLLFVVADIKTNCFQQNKNETKISIPGHPRAHGRAQHGIVAAGSDNRQRRRILDGILQRVQRCFGDAGHGAAIVSDAACDVRAEKKKAGKADGDENKLAGQAIRRKEIMCDGQTDTYLCTNNTSTL